MDKKNNSKFSEKDLLQFTLESIGDGVIVTDLDEKIILINPMAIKLTGYKSEEAVGKFFSEIFNIVDANTGKPLKDPVEVVLRTSKEFDLTDNTRLISRDGTEFLIADSTNPIMDSSGNTLGAIIVFRDVTEQAKIKQKLEASSKDNKNLIDDLQERLKELRGIYGITKLINEEISLNDFFHMVVRLIPKSFQYIEDTQVKIEFEGNIFQTSDLKTSPWKITRDIFYKGEKKGYITVYYTCEKPSSFEGPFLKEELSFLDAVTNTITMAINQKKYEQHILEDRLRLLNILEGTGVGTWEWNISSGRLIINEYWAKMLGYEPKELQPATIETCRNLIHPEDLPIAEKGVHEHFKNQNNRYECEIRMKCKNGSWRWILTRGKVLSWSEDGKPLEMYGTHQDISERIKTENELKRQKEELMAQKEELYANNEELEAMNEELHESEEKATASNRAKSEFLANMSHELRTPLNGVIGFSELLENSELDDDQMEYVSIILTSARNLLHIISDILHFAKLEAGKISIVKEKTDIHKLIEETLSIVEIKAKLGQIHLKKKISLNIPRLILTDPVRLRQVLLNLLSNAIKFTDEGGEVVLSVENIHQIDTQKQVKLRFSVKDNGIGIRQEDREKIFDMFMQADMSSSRRYGGTGLGLTITNRILKLMKSHLNLVSTFGEGSEFSFELECDYSEDASNNHKNQTDDNGEDKKILSKPKKVLIVEDDKINMQYTKTIISRFSEKIIILEAYTGKASLRIFQEEKPDLILMDIIMPGMDGYETVRAIRGMDGNIPIIALTAKAFHADKTMAFESGMNDYLSKPFSPEAIETLLKKHLGEN